MTDHVSLARLLSTLLQAVCPSRQAVSSGVAGCSCLPDRPSPTPPPLRLHEVRLVRAAS